MKNNFFPGVRLLSQFLSLLCSFLRNRWRRRPGVPRSAIHFRFHHHLRRSTPHHETLLPSSTLQSDSKSNFLLCASCLNALSYLLPASFSWSFLSIFYGIPPFLCMSCFLFLTMRFPFLSLSSDLALPNSVSLSSYALFFFFSFSYSPRLAIVLHRTFATAVPSPSHPHQLILTHAFFKM